MSGSDPVYASPPRDPGEGDAARPLSEPILEVRNIEVGFGGVTALADVSLALGRGEILAVIGPNGAGKTTVFNCISGLYRPRRGQILFEGRAIQGMKPHTIAARGIARTFQNIELFSHMTTVDNLLLGRHLRMRSGVLAGMSMLSRLAPAAKEEMRHRERVEEIIEFLDLQAVRREFVANLPYGLRKVVELGRALAMEPKVLLLDEPVAGMNLEEKQDMMVWIRDIREVLGVSMLLIEHDMKIVADLSDRVAVLNHGQKIAEGSAAEIQRHPEVLKAYLGADSAASTEAVEAAQ